MAAFRSAVACLLLVVVVVVVGALGQNDTRPHWMPRLLGTTPLAHAAFLEAYFSEDATLGYADRWTIYVSTFDAAVELDGVYRVRSPGLTMDPVQWNVELMDMSAYWPNNPDYLPSSVAGAEGVVWSSGFIPPGKREGMLQMYDTTQDPLPPAVNIASLDNTTWSYHRVIWKDMDLDGDLDALTARFHFGLLGIEKEFLWLENEGKGFAPGWPQHTLATNGPDVSFALVTLSAGGRTYVDCVVVGEFFNERLTIYWTEDEDGSWNYTSKVMSRVISEESGQVFDVLVDDFNRDGQPEILAPQFFPELGEGNVFIYFFPEDFRTDPFPSIMIADGFIPNDIPGNGETMSPGTPRSYYPNEEFAGELAEDGLPHKPYILLSGDDDGKLYVLYPNSDLRDDWLYQKNIILDTQDFIIGKMAHGDFNDDGYEDLAVAGYSVGQLYLFTYAPDTP